MQQALGLRLRSRATGQLLVEADHALHAGSVGGAADGLQRSSISKFCSLLLSHYVKVFSEAPRLVSTGSGDIAVSEVVAKGGSEEAEDSRWEKQSAHEESVNHHK